MSDHIYISEYFFHILIFIVQGTGYVICFSRCYFPLYMYFLIESEVDFVLLNDGAFLIV